MKKSIPKKALKVGLSQINSRAGDIPFNEQKILSCIKKAQKKACDLLLFPEMALTGYLPRDLLKDNFFLSQVLLARKRIQKSLTTNMRVLLGAPFGDKKALFAGVFLLERGISSPRLFAKEYLANEDVFEEKRYFQKGLLQDNFFVVEGFKIQLLICEEIWGLKPLKIKPHLIVSLHASPFALNKARQRKTQGRAWVKKYTCPLIYLNTYALETELIFDGASFVLNKKAKVFYQSPAFSEDLAFLSFKENSCALDSSAGASRDKGENSQKSSVAEYKLFKKSSAPSPSRATSSTSSLCQALVFGIREFAFQNGFCSAHLGLSGGVDSALTATLAVLALGAKNIRLFFLPGPFTSSLSEKCARLWAKKLNCSLSVQSIQALYALTLQEAQKKAPLSDKTRQNIQARLRALFLMAYANEDPKSLLLGPSNKSELALGYATLYGDITGGLLPLGDLFKTEVYSLARFLALPSLILQRPPTAELSQNQRDEKDIPAYKVLDPILKKLLEEEKSPSNSLERKIFRWIQKTEFKRRQAPPILKVKLRSFDRGRRQLLVGPGLF